MTIKAFPFDNVDTTELEYGALFQTLQGDGFAGVPTDLDAKCVATSGMGLSVGPWELGLAGGFASYSDDDEVRTLDVGGAQPRVDRVVARLSITENACTLQVLKGDPGVPTPKALTRDLATFWEVPIARINVAAGAVNITDDVIFDERPWLGLPVGAWTTDNRPKNPRKGQLGFNFTTGQFEYNADGASDWKPIGASVTAEQISDSTATGRALIKAANAAAGRSALGGGTVGSAVFTAADVVAAREALRIFKGNGPASPQVGDIRLRDA